MSNDRVKVVGYAQKVFYDNGIEYRDFSSDLIGQQLTSDGGTALFTSGNFNITTNSDPKLSKLFKTSEFSNFITLTSLDINDSNKTIVDDNISVKLNLSKNDLSKYAYFGSLREFIRVSLEHIIMNWPGSLHVSPKLDATTGYTATDYYYNPITNISTFKTNVNYLNNKYNVKFLKDGIIDNLYSKEINKRNLTVNYLNYVISGTSGEFNILGYTGSTYNSNDTIYFNVEGNPFTGNSVDNAVYFHIKPNNDKVNEFFNSLPDFEKYLLNRQSTPIYTSKFNYTVKSDNGVALYSEKQITWPSDDGYNLDYNTTKYVRFASDLLTIADSSDSIQTNLISRFFVSDSITDFDTISKNSDNVDSNQKIDKTLKIYGRELDEIKRFIDGLSLVNTITYNKQDNAPDQVIKSLARTLGWDLTTSLQENNIITSFLRPTTSTYSGETIGLTPIETELELWRRIVINTPWIWKSKGTRKVIEFFIKFIGSPTGLISFNEYVYTVKNKLNIDEFKNILELNTGDTDITNLPIDDNGYPKPLPNTSDMYFQKAGLWYRQTGGVNSDIDILGGNNPHIGPYDGGNEYINQFRCLIPYFTPVTLIENNIINNEVILFNNHNNGTVNNIPLSINDNECVCPEGFELNPAGDGCVFIDMVTATPPIELGGIIENGNISIAYGVYGTRFYEDITNKSYPIKFNSDSPYGESNLNSYIYDSTNSQILYSDTIKSDFWGKGTTTTGRLNNIGIGGQPVGEWKGFSQCFNFDEDTTLYIGLGADDYSRFYINGELIVNFDEEYNNVFSFRLWHVFPYTFKSGSNIIEMEGKNKGDRITMSNVHSFGFELYSTSTLSELTSATNTTEAKVTWNTLEKLSDFYNHGDGQPHYDLGDNIGFTCPTDYSLCVDGQEVTCTKIIHEPLDNCDAVIDLHIDVYDSNNTKSTCFDIVTNIIEDPCPTSEINVCNCDCVTEDRSIRIDIKKKQSNLPYIIDCNFTSYELQDNNYVLFTMPDGSKTLNTSEECCLALTENCTPIPDGNTFKCFKIS